MPPRKSEPEKLSRLERQIVDALYRLGEGTAARVTEELDSEDTYDSIRVTLGILKKKGHLKAKRAGNRHVYSPAVPLSRAKRSAVKHLLHTFFEGSSSKAILNLLDSSKMTEQELDEIASLIRKRKRDPS